MRYPHLLSAIRSAKWAVRPATLQAIRDVLSSRLALDRSAVAAGRAEHGPVALPRRAAALQPRAARPGQRIAVIPVFGIIGKRLDEFETMCGGVDVDDIEGQVAAAVADSKVDQIVMHFDSPGGVVTGVPELAAKIRTWSAQKPIHAFTDTLMASAAYWLASACQSIACTRTADVGSIGVYMALIDESEAWAKEGYQMILIKAGARKGEGMPGLPIAPETLAAWQSEVDAIYAMFTADVIASRASVSADAMQGQTFMGHAAVQAQLVDAVVADLAEYVAQLAV